MEKKESPQIAINEEVDMNSLYIAKHGLFADSAMEKTEGHLYPTEKERPSTGKKSKYPGEVVRKGVIKK